jgi:BA14K-like protein
MTSSRFLSGVAALALMMAAPSASFAAWKGGGGGGGVHIGGAPAMGGRMGGAPTANFARVNGPSASFAAVGPRAVGPATTATTTWNGGRTAWNGGGWRGDRDFHHRRFFPGAFVAGAALGAYAAYGGPDYYDYSPAYYDNTYYDNGYYDDGGTVAVVPAEPAGGDAASCAQTYRSYDPASGTYLGYDGLRHPCP